MSRPSFDEYFLDIARVVATRSDCERSKVGAVVVKDRRIRGTGYNGAPAGKPGCASCPRRTSGVVPGAPYDGSDSGRCVAVHAELNAAIHCDREDLIGATMYLTREPCNGCMKVIEAAGIVEVIWPSCIEGINVRWNKDWPSSAGMPKEVVEDWHGKCNHYD